MRTNALKNAIIIVCEDDVTLRIQLNYQMIDKWLWAEGEDDDSFDTDLPDGLESFGPEVLSKFHGEARRDCFFVGSLLGGVESDTVFDEEVAFVFGLGEFDEIRGGIEVVDVGGSG